MLFPCTICPARASVASIFHDLRFFQQNTVRWSHERGHRPATCPSCGVSQRPNEARSRRPRPFLFFTCGAVSTNKSPFFWKLIPCQPSLATAHLLPCRVSCGQGPWTPGVIGLPPGRLSVATHVLSVRLGSHPLRDEIEAIATASRKPTLTPRSPDRSYGNQGLGMVFPEYTSALCRIFGSWQSGRLRLEKETARADMSLYGVY